MTGTSLVRAGLTPLQERAALLEARGGMSKAEIAKAVGVSSKTLTAWGKLAPFKAEVESRSRTALEVLSTEVALLQEEAVDAARKAVAKLVASLDAKDEYDRPYHKIQLDAAIALASSPAIRALVDPRGAGGADVNVQSTSVSVIRIVREGGEDTITYEGEIMEVEDVEHREIPED